MKTLKYIILALIIIPFTLSGQDVINAKEASQLAKKGQAKLISARKAADYSKVHAMGAISVDPASLVDELSMLKSSKEIASLFSSKGLSTTNKLIIYDDGTMKNAGRLYWVFKYMGAKDVKVVNGGMKAWRIGRLPVTKNPTMVKKATFVPQLNAKYLADISLVKNSIKKPGVVILDVRSPEEFNDVAGHIPGAINIEFNNVLQANGSLKDAASLKAVFEANGIKSNSKVIVYCRSSVRAGIVFLALKSSLKYPDVKVYDGAFIEWLSKEPKNIGIE